MNNQEKVELFNQVVLGVKPRTLSLQRGNEFQFSIDALREEIDEMEIAYHKGDLVGVVDALIDLDFFQKGVLFKMGIGKLTYDRCFHVVTQANMVKTGGMKIGRVSYEGVTDAIKPEGWVSPEDKITKVLGEDYGFISNRPK